MAYTPYMTSFDLIASVQRKISFPLSQITFTQSDVLAFANEEMFISQVPSVLQFHEEYFVTYKTLPLITNISKYPIPNRATGMKLRDLFWMDQNGNLFEMTRIKEEDKAFFQRNVGANQAIHKFYIEGNDVVLTPGVVDSPTGSLVFVFFLRPNQLVKNDRAAIVVGFNQTIKINNSLISPLDTVTIGNQLTVFNPLQTVSLSPGDFDYTQTQQATSANNFTPFTAVNTLGGTISAITRLSSQQTTITSVGHQLSSNQTVVITGSDSNPPIDGSYKITVVDADTFNINFQIATVGTTGSFTSVNQFLIGTDNITTATNLANALSLANIGITAVNSATDTVTMTFPNIYTTITPTNTIGFVVPTSTIGVQFNALPSTYTDQETNITSSLFVNNTLIDFLQTNPGHKTYTYDVMIPQTGISGTSIYFNQAQLLVPTGTVNNSGGPNSSGVYSSIQYILAPIVVGDYICLANESIIPQIPPDLHNGLAERTSARILAAIGDQAGLQASNAKIAEIEQRQGNLLDNRSEGNPLKVVNRHSLLRYGKQGTIRRT